jgi:hypothetical protein
MLLAAEGWQEKIAVSLAVYRGSPSRAGDDQTVGL